jgi:hypothetical protein
MEEGDYEPQEAGEYETEGELPAPQSFDLPRSTNGPNMGQPEGVR